MGPAPLGLEHPRSRLQFSLTRNRYHQSWSHSLPTGHALSFLYRDSRRGRRGGHRRDTRPSERYLTCPLCPGQRSSSKMCHRRTCPSCPRGCYGRYGDPRCSHWGMLIAAGKAKGVAVGHVARPFVWVDADPTRIIDIVLSEQRAMASR